MIKYFLTCIYLCVLCLNNVYCQSDGDSGQTEKGYEMELLGYERAYFNLINNTDSTFSEFDRQIQRNEIILKKVFCHKKHGKYEAANETALRLELNGMPDSNQYIYRKEIMFSFYILSKFEDAHNQIVQHKLFSKNNSFQNSLDFWEILILSSLKKYDSADSLLSIYCQAKFNLPFKPDAANTYKNVKKYRPQKAKFLATILPGAGMLYLGKTKDGLISLALQGISLAWGIHNIYSKFYASGFFTGFGLFQTFYFGGIKRTEVLVEELNKSQNEKITKNYLNLMLDMENLAKKNPN